MLTPAGAGNEWRTGRGAFSQPARFCAVTPRQRFLAARIAYVAIVLLATLTGLSFSGNGDEAAARLARAFNPAVSWRDAVDGLRNAVLFAGLGAVWVVTSLSGRVARETRMAALASLLLSATVEGFQVFSPVRNASILDVFTNTLGGFAGAVATGAAMRAVQRLRRDKSYVGIPTLLVAGPYALAVLCEALAPLFDSNPLPYIEGGPFARLAQSLAASRSVDWDALPIWDIPLYAAAGFLLVALVREQRGSSRHQWIGVAVSGALAVLVAHVAHGMFGLAVRWEYIVTDAGSFVLGAWLANRYLGRLTQRYRGADRARGVIVAYTCLLFWWGWRPLIPEWRWTAIAAQIRAEAFIPLAGLAQRVDVFSALHVGQQFMVYLPLGALLAVWPLRFRGGWSHLWPGVWIALVVELGHIVIAGRTFDLTNTLLACSGVAMGWIAVRRSGYRPYGESMRHAR